MKEIHFDTVQQFNDFYGFETLHPLVSVVRFDKEQMLEECMVHYGVYALFLKENKGCKLSYGRTKYDFDEMTVTSFAPGQQLLNNQTLSIAQVSDHLGFGYPQHFVRFFKRKTGKTPTGYRAA